MAMNISGSYYAPEYDQRFDSEVQYMRYKEAQHYEAMRRGQMAMQQAGLNPYITNSGTAQKANSPKKTEDDPLGFLYKSDNKLLLTGEAS
jgi:hypothetical protein